MKPLELTDDLLTGIEDIDDQHQHLFKIANIITSDEESLDEGQFHATLDNLADYVNDHFRAEEYAMDKYGFDGLEKHKNQHSRLNKEVTNLFNRFKREGASKGLRVELQYMVSDWYILHIKEWDMPFAKYMKGINKRAVSLPDF
jgi:hemerythrin-like metal-binding protein